MSWSCSVCICAAAAQQQVIRGNNSLLFLSLKRFKWSFWSSRWRGLTTWMHYKALPLRWILHISWETSGIPPHPPTIMFEMGAVKYSCIVLPAMPRKNLESSAAWLSGVKATVWSVPTSTDAVKKSRLSAKLFFFLLLFQPGGMQDDVICKATSLVKLGKPRYDVRAAFSEQWNHLQKRRRWVVPSHHRSSLTPLKRSIRLKAAGRVTAQTLIYPPALYTEFTNVLF